MKKNIYKKIRAFSLIETMIAISILMIAITGPLSLVQAGLFSSIHQRNQVTAIYLAQEALEYIKNIRDTNSYLQYTTNVNWLTGPDGNSLITTCGIAVSGCYVDPHGRIPAALGNNYIQPINSSNPKLRLNIINAAYDATNNLIGGISLYSYDLSGTATVYTRKVAVAYLPGTTDEATVTVTVNWYDNALYRTYTITENIFNYEE